MNEIIIKFDMLTSAQQSACIEELIKLAVSINTVKIINQVVNKVGVKETEDALESIINDIVF